jgi:hypothetical protein
MFFTHHRPRLRHRSAVGRCAMRYAMKPSRRGLKFRTLLLSGMALALLAMLRLDRFLGMADLRFRRTMWNKAKVAFQSVVFRALLVGGIAVALVLAATLYLGHSTTPERTSDRHVHQAGALFTFRFAKCEKNSVCTRRFPHHVSAS